MICIAKPYARQRSISPKLVVWAFKRTGLKPTVRGSGMGDPGKGCAITAVSYAMRAGRWDAADARLRGSYAMGIWFGWDRGEVAESDNPEHRRGCLDAIAARKALTEAGITP